MRHEQAPENSVLYQGTTLVGPYTTPLMRALAPEVLLSCPLDLHFLYENAGERPSHPVKDDEP
jgi:hypothetical protein